MDMGFMKFLGVVALTSAILVSSACVAARKKRKTNIDDKKALADNLTIVIDKKDYKVE